MKVVAVSDKKGTAIDRLCHGVEKYHDNLEYIVCDVHPKRPDPEQLAAFEAAAKDADIIDYQYFRTADMLREKYPEIKKIPSILTHNNPYSVRERDWNDYQIVVANNKTMEIDLSRITSSRLEYIPLCVDADFWHIPDKEWIPKDQVIMVANRIESKKGVLEVALACAEIGVKFVLVGAVSDPNYMNDIMATGDVEFHQEISDEDLRDLYWKSKLHVCNSQDNFESGTLPILESMLCGVPVLTRSIGHVPDLYNGENMVINDNSNEDVVKLTELLKETLDKDLADMRNKAWNTAKTRNHERRAYGYQLLYRSLISDEKTVSVIVPVCDKPSITEECIRSIMAQTYSNIEIIVCDDGLSSETEPLIKELSRSTKFPIRYIKTTSKNEHNEDYGLARARNKAIVEATGKLLVFCDQRMIMDKKAVSVFSENVSSRVWVYGTKGIKKEFVENFSAVYREDLVRIGMFNERIDRYGGMSQYIRSVAKLNGFQLVYNDNAIARPVGKSGNKYSKRQDIMKIKNKLWKLGLEL